MLGSSALGYDTLLGMGVGAVGMWWMWNKLESWAEGPELAPRKDRKFAASDLAQFDGAKGKLAYVAVGTDVFDVSKDPSGSLRAHAGGSLPAEEVPADLAAFAQTYRQVGTLIVMRNMSKAQLAAFDGRQGRPVYVAAKGVIYDVDPDFYGPEGPYGIMAGRDASRALALVSLDEADMENTCIDDLQWMDLNTLEEWIAKFEMKYHRVGFLVGEGGLLPEAALAEAPAFLRKERQSVVLDEKTSLSHDTRLFRFKLPGAGMKLGLPIGKHVTLYCPNPTPVKEGEWNGRPDTEAGKAEIQRKYTPSSLEDEMLGGFELVIKVYNGATPALPQFPDGGKMSQHLDSLKVGDELEVSGPYGLIQYLGKGAFSIRRKERRFGFVGMVAGGTGVTPMLQLIKAVLRDPKDETKLSLLFANQTEDDILVRDMLEEQAALHPERFKISYTLDRPPKEGWAGYTGFINEDMINETMPPPGEDTLILACGPPPMIKFAVKPNVAEYANFCEF